MDTTPLTANRKGKLTMKRIIEAAFLIILAVSASVYFQRLYFSWGMGLSENPAFMRYNTVFGADIPRVVGDLTDEWANHYRTKVHPLFVLFFNSIGARMASAEFGSATEAAIWLTSLAGALCPVVLLGYLLLIGVGSLEAILLALIYGFSAGQLLWSSVPETFVYGTLTLLITHGLAVSATKKSPVALAFLPIGGILSIGITTTNYIQAVVAFIASVRGQINSSSAGIKRLVRPAVYFVLMLLVSISGAVALSNLQKAKYPSSIQFYKKEAYDEESRYTRLDNLRQPISTLKALTLNFGAFALMGPPPDVVSLEDGQGSGAVFSEGCFGKYSASQRAALAIWTAIIIAGLYSGWMRMRGITLTLIACLGANYAIHSVYGTDEAFLYSAHVQFLFVALAGLSAVGIRREKSIFHLLLAAALIAVLAIEIKTNFEFMDRLGMLMSILQ